MAVFTVVSDQQLKDWLAQYDAGELLAIEPIASGIENTNYFVERAAGSSPWSSGCLSSSCPSTWS